MKEGLILLTFMILAGTIAFGQDKVVPYKINNVKAYFYYNEKSNEDSVGSAGTMSEDLFDNGSISLWNSANEKGYSHQTFVVVEISGNPKGYIQREITLTAMSHTKLLFKKTQIFSIIDQHQKYFAPFLIYDTGCTDLTITAEIKNKQATESKLTKTIPFPCGE